MTDRMIYFLVGTCLVVGAILLVVAYASAGTSETFPVGPLKPVDSATALKVGDTAPDFDLPSISGKRVRLADYRGKKNVVISFVPAAWTPVCSDQWPGYNIALDMFAPYDAILLGITVDNVPSLWTWAREMGGLDFPVLSDFFPHGATARKYGILRSDGMAERALFVIDKKGIVRWFDVHDINQRPKLEELIKGLKNLD